MQAEVPPIVLRISPHCRQPAGQGQAAHFRQRLRLDDRQIIVRQIALFHQPGSQVLGHPFQGTEAGHSAVDLLTLLKADPLLSPDLKLIVDHLTLRVTEEFKLPIEADLVSEAITLCEALLNQKGS